MKSFTYALNVGAYCRPPPPPPPPTTRNRICEAEGTETQTPEKYGADDDGVMMPIKFAEQTHPLTTSNPTLLFGQVAALQVEL